MSSLTGTLHVMRVAGSDRGWREPCTPTGGVQAAHACPTQARDHRPGDRRPGRGDRAVPRQARTPPCEERKERRGIARVFEGTRTTGARSDPATLSACRGSAASVVRGRRNVPARDGARSTDQGSEEGRWQRATPGVALCRGISACADWRTGCDGSDTSAPSRTGCRRPSGPPRAR